MEFLTGENVSIILFFIGIAGIFSSRRMLKTIISVAIMEVSAVMFYLTMNATPQDVPPIIVGEGIEEMAQVADPLPQALMITAIVIGVAVTAIALCMFINLYHLYGNSDWKQIHEMRMEQS